MKRMSRPLCSRRYHVDVRNSRFRRLRAIDRAGRFICLPHERANTGAGSADRAACHEWAVAQTGHDPSLVFAAQQAGCQTRAIANVTRQMGTTPARSVGGARGMPRDPPSERTLRRVPSGGTGLLRGQRLPSFKIGASNANLDL